MTYYSKIEQSKNKVYNHAIASKILELMDKLRMDENANYSRRWIWELIQNAKDVAHENIGVSIEIDLQKDNNYGFVEFKHNGKPFSTDNLTFLIEQVSTKDRNAAESSKSKITGKFGTGFLSTHLLSEKVEVQSILKEDDEPYRKFDILLDRTGRCIGEIIDSVNESLALIESIDSNPTFNEYSISEYNTAFRYELDEDGIEVAKIGLKDLNNSLIFTLAFVPEIKMVTIINENIKYELSQSNTHEKNIKIYTITKSTSTTNKEYQIALLSKNDVCIAVEIEYVNNQIFLKEFDSSIPRIFCDFPLIGTEDFPFPVIINSPMFNPTEPRNGVYLTNKSESRIEENKALLQEAMELFYILLEYASENDWGNIHLLAKIPTFKAKEWLSKEWLENEILKPIKEKLLITPIVDTENFGRISIIDENQKLKVWFPYSSKEILRSRIWELANQWIPSMLPRKADVEVWYKIIWSDCNRLTLEVLTNSIQKRENLNRLGEEMVKSTNPINWLNSYYEILNLDDDFLNNIINDKYVVIPNQNGIFKKRSELKIDEGIEEELKNVLSILNVNCRDHLLLNGVHTGEKIKYNVENQDEIVNEINKMVNEGKNDNISLACDYLITLFCDDNNFPEERELIFELCKAVYPEDVSAKRKILTWLGNTWLEADKKEMKWIAQAISETENVNALTEKLKFDYTSQTLTWLNTYVSFLIKYDYDNLLNLKTNPILPNQNGYFRTKDNLFLDDGEIDEALKDISSELGYDFRDDLLDVNIYLDLPQSRTINQLHVAEEIKRLITPKLSEIIRADKTKQIFRKLYLWFNKNKEIAQKNFGELYVNKHRLYDDDEIAENIQKAEELSELMDQFDIDDLSELRQVLQANKTHDFLNQREQMTQDTLASLGVTSIEELEEALKDKDIAAQFIRISTPSIEMFQYVQSLITRAKKNVIEYLKTIPDYDCSEWEELATTVIGGIRKEGLMINVVVRPSDNGEVIVYYSSEKDSLDYANAELWIDNGLEEPRHLTLGRILKTTGINRIPV